jgi:hypothetical protein
MSGREFERQVKSWVRNQGFPAAVSAAQMKYRGHTETVLTNDVSIMELQGYIVSLVGRQPQVPTPE